MSKAVVHLTTDGKRIWIASAANQWLAGLLGGHDNPFPGLGDSKSGAAFEWMRDVAGFGPRVCWTAPLNYRSCMDLRKIFPKGSWDIEIHQPLWAWAAEELAVRRKLAKIRASGEWPTPRLAREYPELNAAVHARPFQSVGIGFAVTRRRSVNGDHPGLGKTLQAAAAAVEDGIRGPILVAAPASAAGITWPDEFNQWLPGEKYTVVEGSKERRTEQIARFWEEVTEDRKRRHWMFINPEMLQPDRYKEIDEASGVELTVHDSEYRFPKLFSRPWSMFILDEAHKYLPVKSGQKSNHSMIRQGLRSVPVRPSGLKMALSGTPFKGNALNFWGSMNWLYPEQYSGYNAYVDRWFEVVSEDWDEDRKRVEGLKEEAAAEFGAEIDALMIRRTKSEVASDLPPKQYGGTRLNPKDRKSPHGVWLDMTPKQDKIYQSMVKDAVARLESGELLPGGVLAEMVRLKQFACSYGDVTTKRVRIPSKQLVGLDLSGVDPEDLYIEKETFAPALPSNKFDWLVEFLAERGIERGGTGTSKVVVASQFTKLLICFAAELRRKGIPTHLLTGAQNREERGRMKREFQAPGGPRVFLLNTAAGGVSLTLDRADDMVILDETWIPDDQEQVEDRIHRLSNPDHTATYWYLRSRGTIDERIAARNEGADQIQKQLLDVRRGVEVAKQLIRPEGVAA